MTKIQTLSGLDPALATAQAQQARAQQATKSLSDQDLKDTKKLEKSLNQFEALLLHQMLKAMWETVDTAGLFGENGNEAQIYRDMLNQAISDSASEGQGIGVKEVVKKELLKNVQS